MADLPKFVESRLRAGQVSGNASGHPEADILSAFSEQSLTATERAVVTDHLATCATCREIVSISAASSGADAAVVVSGVGRVPDAARRPWREMRFLQWGAGAAVATAVVGGVLLLRPEQKIAPAAIIAQKQEAVSDAIAIDKKSNEPSAATPASTSSVAEKPRNEKVASPKPTLTDAEAYSRAREHKKNLKDESAGLYAKADMAKESDGSAKPRAAEESRTVAMERKAAKANGEFDGGNAAIAKTEPLSSETGAFNRLGSAKTKSLPAASAATVSAVEIPDKLASAAPVMEDSSKSKSAASSDGRILARAMTHANTQQAPRAIPPVQGQVKSRALALQAESQTNADQIGDRRGLDQQNGSPTDRVRSQVAEQVARTAPKVGGATNSAPSNLEYREANRLALESKLASARSRQSTTLWRVQDGKLQRQERQVVLQKAKGSAWQDINVMPDPKFRAVAAMDASVWVGGARGVLYHSLDDGHTWSEVAGDWTGDITGIALLSPQQAQLVTSIGEKWITEDAGKSWKKLP